MQFGMGHWIRAGIAVRAHVLKWPELPWRPYSEQNQLFADFVFWGGALLPIAYCLLPIAYCLLPIAYLDAFGGLDAYCLRMHTASECMLPLNAFGRRMHSAADAFGGPPGVAGRGAGGVGPCRGARGREGSHPGRAAECIQRQYAFGGSMHPGRRMHPARHRQ